MKEIFKGKFAEMSEGNHDSMMSEGGHGTALLKMTRP
jgi:hypothetical protein